MNVVHAFYDRPHPQGSTRYVCVYVCVCVKLIVAHINQVASGLNRTGLVAAVLVWGIVSLLQSKEEEERGLQVAENAFCVQRSTIRSSA